MVIFVPNLANSQTQFSARVAETLVAGGHDVTLVLATYMSDFKTDVKLPDKVKMYQLDCFVEGVSKSKMEHEASKAMFVDPGILGIPRQIQVISNTTHMITEGCRQILRNKEFLNWLKSEKFDLAYASAVSTCDIGLIHYAGIPTWAWLSSAFLFDHMAKIVGVPIIPSFVPTMVMEATDEMGFVERTKSWIGHAITLPVYKRSMADPETQIFRKELEDPDFPHTLDLAAKCPLVILNTNEIYDLPRPTLAKIINIGGLGVGFDSAKPLTGKIKEISETGKGLIIFSFGSVAGAHEMPLSWKNAFLDAFSLFPDYQFVMRYLADDLNDRLPKNVHLFKWLPQKDLLLHDRTKAFITHGGYNSLQEAMSSGVPLVTIALFGDQPKNSALARKLGFAVNIAKSSVSKETVVEALTEIINNPSYKKNVKRLSAMVRAQPQKPAERLLKWSEFLAEFKEIENFIPAGNKLNAIQYHSIDVIGFLLLALIIIIAIVVVFISFFVSKCLSVCRRRSSTTKTKHD